MTIIYAVEDRSLVVVFSQVFGVFVIHCRDDNLKVQVWNGLWWHGIFGTYVTNAYIIVGNDDDLSSCQGSSVHGSIFYMMKYESLWMNLLG